MIAIDLRRSLRSPRTARACRSLRILLTRLATGERVSRFMPCGSPPNARLEIRDGLANCGLSCELGG